MKYGRPGNDFSLPNEIFFLKLSPRELAVYSYQRLPHGNHRTLSFHAICLLMGLP